MPVFRFHGELNDFLHRQRRDVDFEAATWPTDTLKHVIESLGIPHPEIGWVEVNQVRVALSGTICEHDSVAVFPPEKPIRLQRAAFVVDGHLGRVAAYLRMLGLDTWWQPLADDPLLASISAAEERVLLTRDVGLLKRKEVALGYCVRADYPRLQLRKLWERFALQDHAAPFTRCMACNGPLAPVEKSSVADRLPPHTLATKTVFSQCQNCGKVYWRGTHYDRMLGWIEDLRTKDSACA